MVVKLKWWLTKVVVKLVSIDSILYITHILIFKSSKLDDGLDVICKR